MLLKMYHRANDLQLIRAYKHQTLFVCPFQLHVQLATSIQKKTIKKTKILETYSAKKLDITSIS